MKLPTLVLTAALLPLVAHAEPASAPVDRIMKVAEARWATMDGNAPDYFDNLDRDFSKGFATVYRDAAKYPAYDGGTSPFDYDVITSSQDGCPLKDVTVSPEGEKSGTTVIDVSFKLWTCAPDAESQSKVNELKFDVVNEGGKPVIADIHRLNESKWDSLVAEMKQGIEYAKNPPQQQE